MNDNNDMAGQQRYYSPNELLEFKPSDIVVKLTPRQPQRSRSNPHSKGVPEKTAQWQRNKPGGVKDRETTATSLAGGSMIVGNKRVYSIQYLLSLSQKQDCQGPPIHFPPSMIRIMLPQHIKSIKQRKHNNVGNHANTNARRSGRHASGGSGAPVRRIILPSRENIKLHTTKNKWIPESVKPTSTTTADADGAVIKRANGILNKLTKKTFHSLCNQLLACGVTTVPRMNGVLGLIFEKALDQAFFSELYANVCKKMCALSALDDGQDNKQVDFRRLLLHKCQEEFKRVTSAHASSAAPEPENSDAKSNTSASPTAAEAEERLLAEFKAKRHLLGFMRFIGELFKVNIIQASILNKCMSQLLGICHHGDDYIESSCQVLTTVGPVLDGAAATGKDAFVNNWFRELESKKRLPGVSTRVRFLVENLVDVRLNAWVGHSDGDSLKTITDAATDDNSPTAVVPGTPSGRSQSSEDPNRSIQFITPQPSPHEGSTESRRPEVTPRVVAAPPPPTQAGATQATGAEQGSAVEETLSARAQDRIRNTVDEYVSVRDMNEVRLCLDEFHAQFGNPALLHFWECTICKIMDCAKESDRDALLEAIAEAAKHDRVNRNLYQQALCNCIMMVEDLAIDVPYAGTHFAAAVAAGISENLCDFDFFEDAEFLALGARLRTDIYSAAIAEAFDDPQSQDLIARELPRQLAVVFEEKAELVDAAKEALLRRNPDFATLLQCDDEAA
eukprot:m.538164 g.538164  ORF g.538164 m.538164 type:complete len:731 (-) comp22079_c0_seq1:458-2650(-)